MSENKKEIIAALLPVLQNTRGFSDLKDIQYGEKDRLYDEYVDLIFESGAKKRINVTADSGIAMIMDILLQGS